MCILSAVAGSFKSYSKRKRFLLGDLIRELDEEDEEEGDGDAGEDDGGGSWEDCAAEKAADGCCDSRFGLNVLEMSLAKEITC